MIVKLTQAQVVEALAAVPLFSGLTRRQLRSVARVCSAVQYEPGTTLLKERDVAQHMAVILGGRATVVRRGQVLADVGPGDVVGEMSLLDGAPRSASVVAETTVDAILLYATDVRALLEREPAICMRLLVAQTARLRALDHRLATLG